MGKGYRQGRLGEEIRKIISEMLLREIKDPRLSNGLISLSDVEVTSDGSYATCYITYISMKKGEEAVLEEEEILDPMDLINQYQEKRASLNAEIDHVLEKITSLLGGN